MASRQVVMSPTEVGASGKRRARMGGADKTPEGPTPRKRKPVTRTRTSLRDYFTPQKDKENKPEKVGIPNSQKLHDNYIVSNIFATRQN